MNDRTNQFFVNKFEIIAIVFFFVSHPIQVSLRERQRKTHSTSNWL